jgi:hypothetical protein
MADLEMQALDLWWTSIFLDGGWDEPMVAYVLVQPGETYTSECYWEEDEPLVITGETESAYYCDYDVAPVNGEDQNGVIWLPVAPLLTVMSGDIWGLGEVSHPEYLPIAIIAHEFSHHVQAELWHQAGDEGTYVPWPEKQNMELVADCLAGTFMAAFDQVEEIADDDLTGIIQGFMLVGDPLPTMDDHGTASERALAFTNGYFATDGVNECLGTYWPAYLDEYGNL